MTHGLQKEKLQFTFWCCQHILSKKQGKFSLLNCIILNVSRNKLLFKKFLERLFSNSESVSDRFAGFSGHNTHAVDVS